MKQPLRVLSTDKRAIRLGFDPAEFGLYSTDPTHQTLTNVWDGAFSTDAKRTVRSLSEQLVTAAYQNDAALDLQISKGSASRSRKSLRDFLDVGNRRFPLIPRVSPSEVRLLTRIEGSGDEANTQTCSVRSIYRSTVSLDTVPAELYLDRFGVLI